MLFSKKQNGSKKKVLVSLQSYFYMSCIFNVYVSVVRLHILSSLRKTLSSMLLALGSSSCWESFSGEGRRNTLSFEDTALLWIMQGNYSFWRLLQLLFA